MSAAFSANINTGAWILPFVVLGIAEASTTRKFSIPCTFIVNGSTTAIGSDAGPIFALQDGCNAVSPSLRTQSRISSSVWTCGPGEISPPLNGSIAFCFRIFLATLIASTHSLSSSFVDK